MSGGSLDYVYIRVEDAAWSIGKRAETPLHKAFAKHLHYVAAALHDLEWLYSGDYSDGREVDSIRRCLSPEAELEAIIQEAGKIVECANDWYNNVRRD